MNNNTTQRKPLLVFGTRPEVIKLCPLAKTLQKESESIETIVCVTGQHRELLSQVEPIFHVKPDMAFTSSTGINSFYPRDFLLKLGCPDQVTR